MTGPTAQKIARAILDRFDHHFASFQRITAAARERFRDADWAKVQAASRERIDYYDQWVQETTSLLRRDYGISELDEPQWQQIKIAYVILLHQHS